MKIEKLKIEDIVHYANNAKEHPQEQIDKIKASIKEFGFNDPVAVDEKNVLIEGHGRIIALQQLGCDVVDAIKLYHLSYRVQYGKVRTRVRSHKDNGW